MVGGWVQGGWVGGSVGGRPPPPPQGDPELLEAPKAPEKIFWLKTRKKICPITSGGGGRSWGRAEGGGGCQTPTPSGDAELLSKTLGGGGVPGMAGWRSPLTRKHSRNLSESRIRAVQCYDCPTKGDAVADITDARKCSGNCHDAGPLSTTVHEGGGGG